MERKEKENEKEEEKKKKKEEKRKVEKFYKAGKYDMTTTTKPVRLTNLYKVGSLRDSDPNTYYGGYLEDLKKEEEEEVVGEDWQ